ncbi:hypothetical protein SLEP1_g52725 [Rubroshorea leprosula]|uniref:Uncharacterized protein n=1 Tax=Rubroshorea leprosula TaxID=152421 RepID=A0AAV5MAL3_9ROSI|nr:hypothetical protein SLEP1_g52725 [Rubroshorea leprosula]
MNTRRPMKLRVATMEMEMKRLKKSHKKERAELRD